MAEDRSSAGNGDSHSTVQARDHSIWQGLRTLIFGGPGADTLRDAIEDAIDRHEGDPAPDVKGDLSPLERQMVRNLLHFGERDAGDVGVPRADIVAVEEGTSFAELVALFAEAGHSRLPVYREKLDTIIGMVHIKDVFNILATGAAHPDSLAGLIREPLWTPMSRGALDLLADMRAKRVHLAVVVDEYGGTEGLVTIEDLVEEIVGEIEDEHDDAPVAMLVPLDGGAWDLDARVTLEEAARAVDPRLEEVEVDVDTIGGLAAVLAGHVPAPGDCVDHPSGWRLEITEADERRVHRVRLHPPRPESEE
ncbi:hemolysin family protein [Sphingomonas sp.]|uniref:hemolysin family protein n=1 Tax=Sphingomonas sp. TaxID=28214 RepID=UPI0035C7C8E5